MWWEVSSFSNPKTSRPSRPGVLNEVNNLVYPRLYTAMEQWMLARFGSNPKPETLSVKPLWSSGCSQGSA
jgi:hypothetical protein